MLFTNLTLTTVQAATVLSRWLGEPVTCDQVEPLQGGMINSALRLRFDRAPGTAVVKLNADRDNEGLRSEQRRLDYLNANTQLPVPRAYRYAAADAEVPYTCLLLETIPGVNLTQATLAPSDRSRVEGQLADILIELHGHTRQTFGRIHEPGRASWSDVFVPDLVANRKHVEEKLPVSVLDQIDTAIEAAPAILSEQGVHTLIHQDIWAGNIMVDQRGDEWHLAGLVDPSGSKFADVECELAYLQVFDTVGGTFFDRYTDHHPLRPGYEVRRLFYWLDTYMTHVWLFGDQSYRDRTAEVAEAIAAHAG